MIKQRVNILSENITKWGHHNNIVTNNDPKDFSSLVDFFDLIVIDAPCSGSGLFRKDSKAIEEWSEQNVKLCSQRQQRIISEIQHCFKNKGVMIYSTCSYSREENEDVVDWMMSEFDCETIQISYEKNWGIVETQSEIKKGFGYRFYPNKVEGEGFFIAVLRFNVQPKKQKYKTQKFLSISKSENNIVQQHIETNDDLIFFKHNSNIICFTTRFYVELEVIAAYLYIKKAGIEIGIINGNKFIPAHELAVSTLKLKNFNKISIPIVQVLQYLTKKVVIIEVDFKGWVLISYKNINIGWIKVLDNRINNYYPTNWRILTSLIK